MTVKEKDGENDSSSNLDRNEIFRVNLGVRKATFSKLFDTIPKRSGKSETVSMQYDFSSTDCILPHPVYAWRGWICSLSPSEKTFAELKPPSSKNRQPWKYIVVQGDAKEEMLRGFRQGIEREENECALLPQSKRYIAAAKHTVDLMEAAPTIVLVVNSIGKNEMGEMTPEEHVYEICNIQSIGASIQNMLLAATEKGIGSLWICDAYYEDGCFYIITYAASNKMKQIDHNPIVAVAGEWFTAHGKGINLGWFCKKENHEMAQKLRQAFSEWIDNGHNNFDDENTIILCIQLTEGTLFSHGTRYDIDFSDN